MKNLHIEARKDKCGARYSGNIGFAIYNSWQTTVSKRLNRGLYFQGAYTWSRTVDNVSGSLSTDELNATRAGQNGGNIYGDQANPQANKARGDFDRPHRLVVSYSYDLPAKRARCHRVPGVSSTRAQRGFRGGSAQPGR
ncbi:MAG TPA: hypothetical protein VJV21_05855 [Pyrinomonadaceae bacterium]|nr:hypothetical protein [Pyrinomonadaceae bacterium]